jgi:hypothetical protein
MNVYYIFMFTVLDRKPNVVDKNWAGQILLFLKLCMSKQWIRQWYCTRQHLRPRRESEQEQRRKERVPILVVEQTRNLVLCPSPQLTRVVFVKKICQLVNRFRFGLSALECPMIPA